MYMKRILTILIAAAIILCVLPAVTASAEDVTSGTTGECTWTLDGTVLTISGTGTAGGDGRIPWGYSVTEVIIEPGVTGIGRWTFNYQDYLTTVTISDSVTSIGEEAFAYLPSLTSVIFGNGVTTIEASAFSNSWRLQNISLPDSLVTIGDLAFTSVGIESITIPASVVSIGSSAFGENLYLGEIVFEGDVPNLGENVFHWDLMQEFTPEIKVHYPANNSTWTEDVLQSFRDASGAITLIPYEVTKEKPVAQWNVSLEDDLKVNFYLDGEIKETAQATVTIGDSVKTCNISELEKDENGYYIVSVNVAAVQMTDEIAVQVTDMEPAVYTVRQYCDTILGDESYSQYHQLIKEMLNYGAMAQIYFDHNSENLANNDITGVAAEEVPDTTADLSVDGEVDGMEFYGASLVYRDKIAVRLYYNVTGNVSAYTFTANGNIYTPVRKGDQYYVEVADILPQDLEQQILLTVKDNSGNTLTVAYGPMNYIVRMSTKGSESTKALLTALYNYHLAAKALRTETV